MIFILCISLGIGRGVLGRWSEMIFSMLESFPKRECLKGVRVLSVKGARVKVEKEKNRCILCFKYL